MYFPLSSEELLEICLQPLILIFLILPLLIVQRLPLLWFFKPVGLLISYRFFHILYFHQHAHRSVKQIQFKGNAVSKLWEKCKEREIEDLKNQKAFSITLDQIQTSYGFFLFFFPPTLKQFIIIMMCSFLKQCFIPYRCFMLFITRSNPFNKKLFPRPWRSDVFQ